MRRSQSPKGKRYLITGGAGGLGSLITAHLVQAGAEVIVTSRDPIKAEQCLAEKGALSTQLSIVPMDLCDPLDIVRAATDISLCGSLDGIVLNAGMLNHTGKLDGYGFEMQLTANYLGHVLLMDRIGSLLKKKASRVIHVSSIASVMGRLDASKWCKASRYPYFMYAQSKLSTLMYGLMMSKHFSRNGDHKKSIVCHPGICRTHLFKQDASSLNVLSRIPYLLAQPPNQGANIILDCLLSDEVKNGAYYGPNGWLQLKGKASPCYIPTQALNEVGRENLWFHTQKAIHEQWGLKLSHSSGVIALETATP